MSAAAASQTCKCSWTLLVRHGWHERSCGAAVLCGSSYCRTSHLLTDVNTDAECAAADANFAVVRMFGFSVQQGINNQVTPSADPTKVVYNESMLVAFDRAIAELSSRNLKAIVALANNWDYNGNMSDCKYARALKDMKLVATRIYGICQLFSCS